MSRRRFHRCALFVLVAMLGSVLMPLAGGLHAEDVACADDAWGGPSHHQTTQFESIRPSVGDGHCAICHLQRTMTGAADDAKRFVAASVVATPYVAAVERAPRSHARRDVPPRAPPSFVS